MWRISEQACRGLRAVPVRTHAVWRPGDHPANLRQESSPGPPPDPAGKWSQGHTVSTEQRLQVSEATQRGDQVECQMVEDEQEQALACQGQSGVTSAAGCTTLRAVEAEGLRVLRVKITGEVKDNTEGWQQHSADTWGCI